MTKAPFVSVLKLRTKCLAQHLKMLKCRNRVETLFGRKSNLDLEHVIWKLIESQKYRDTSYIHKHAKMHIICSLDRLEFVTVNLVYIREIYTVSHLCLGL